MNKPITRKRLPLHQVKHIYETASVQEANEKLLAGWVLGDTYNSIGGFKYVLFLFNPDMDETLSQDK